MVDWLDPVSIADPNMDYSKNSRDETLIGLPPKLQPMSLILSKSQGYDSCQKLLESPKKTLHRDQKKF